MKKLAIMLCSLCILTSSAIAAENNTQPVKKMAPPTQEQMAKIRKAHQESFEKKLGLTEVQKLKTRELRRTSHEKIKPVIDKIRQNKQEAEAIRRSNLSVEAQEEKLIVIDKELRELEKQAAVIRKQNMKDFESILTKEQRKILKQMKKEGRKNFEHGRRAEITPCPPPRPFEK